MTRRMLDARLCPPGSMGAALAAALLALGSAQAQTPPARLDDPSAPLREAARTEKRVDLITLYREALQNDAQFQAARYQAQATAEREPQARAALLPSLNASGDFFVRRYDGTNPTVGNTYGDYGAGLSLLVPVYRPQSWETLEQSRLQVLQGENSLAQARQDLAVRLANAYFNVLAARDQVNSLEVQKEATLQQLAQARREFEVGTKTIIDTNEAQARYDQIVAALQVAVGQLLIRRNELRAIVGRDPEVLAGLADAPRLQLPQPNEAAVWVKATEDGNFGVRNARATVEIARREVQRARHGHKPTVDVVANYGIRRFDGTQLSGTEFRANSGNIGVQLNVPLYTGGLTQSRVREALALESRSASDLENVLRTATNNARAAFTGVNYGLTQVQALESAERSARTQLESTRLGYQVGVRIQLDVLNATTQLVSTQRDLKRARYDFLISGLNLKAAAGSLAEDDLQAVNRLLTQ
jgi:outer membrane protein